MRENLKNEENLKRFIHQTELRINNFGKITKTEVKHSMIKYSFFVIICFLTTSCIQSLPDSKSDQVKLEPSDSKISNHNIQKKLPVEDFEETFSNNAFKISGFFDKDKVQDTIYYELVENANEPIFKCKILYGDSYNKVFLYPTGTGFIEFSNCGIGCIEISEIFPGAISSEEIKTFLYDENFQNWMIYKIVTKKNNVSEEKSNFKVLWSIDNKIKIPKPQN